MPRRWSEAINRRLNSYCHRCEKEGLIKGRVIDMKTKLEELREMVYACTRCGYCREKYSDEVYTATPVFQVCPVREHSGGFEKKHW